MMPEPSQNHTAAVLDTDDAPAVALCAAVCEVAVKDAQAGDSSALQWLAELRAHRPRSSRWHIPMETHNDRAITRRTSRAL